MKIQMLYSEQISFFISEDKTWNALRVS